ncbi:hypothetical protein [Actinocorallia herbida]|uniref:hypothetical protein n=1 Tax=Actinocorallia herbida TaxID=58109 RepID=UPI001FE60B09|nr:hypothetical protein [Actinocorallia herbida]
MDAHVTQPVDTLHGQLQRGLGRAARRAARTRGSGEFVYDCVRRDPRWDRQVESRSLYYARLIVDLELPVHPLSDHLFDPADADDGDEWRASLTIDTLTDLVRLSRREAAAPLRRYAADGAHWFEALDALVSLGDPALVPGLGAVAAARCDEDDLHWLVDDPGNPVIRQWAAEYPVIAEAVSRRGSGPTPRAREHARPTGSDGELVALAHQRSDASVEAILELGRRRSPALFDLAEEFLPEGAGRWRGVICRALRECGPAALPSARRWASGTPGCRKVAIAILAGHGTAQDVPVLVDDLAAALKANAWGRAAHPVEGLGRLRAGAAVSLLKEAWTATEYAYLRPRLLTALLRTAPHTAEAYAAEALWDCEEEARRIGASMAPLTEDNGLRLRRLATCAAEEPGVVSAAVDRSAPDL